MSDETQPIVPEPKDLTVKDLKAMAYDTLARIEQLQMQLREINQRIASLSAAQPMKEEVKS